MNNAPPGPRTTLIGSLASFRHSLPGWALILSALSRTSSIPTAPCRGRKVRTSQEQGTPVLELAPHAVAADTTPTSASLLHDSSPAVAACANNSSDRKIR